MSNVCPHTEYERDAVWPGSVSCTKCGLLKGTIDSQAPEHKPKTPQSEAKGGSQSTHRMGTSDDTTPPQELYSTPDPLYKSGDKLDSTQEQITDWKSLDRAEKRVAELEAQLKVHRSIVTPLEQELWDLEYRIERYMEQERAHDE